ncbi:galactose mutarotase-like domain-containing protein [Lipomyces starkeyi]
MAKLFHAETKLHLDGETSEPYFQLYTGKYINVPNKYSPRAGLCLESSRHVDAINNPNWRNMVTLGKNQTYGSLTKYSLYYQDSFIPTNTSCMNGRE